MRTQSDPCADGRSSLAEAETDWLPIILAFGTIVYAGANYIGHKFGFISLYTSLARSPYVRITCAVFQRIAIDCIRYVLAVLGIALIIILECKKALSSFFRGDWCSSAASSLRENTSAFERMSLQYDAASNGHCANATRQQLRAARARLGTLLWWAIPVAAMLMLLHGPPEYKDSSPKIEPQVRSYVVPSWVITARPENRRRDGSSSHYVPAGEHLVFYKNYYARFQSSESQSIEGRVAETQIITPQDLETLSSAQSFNIMPSSSMEQIDIPEGALAAFKSKDMTLTDKDGRNTDNKDTRTKKRAQEAIHEGGQSVNSKPLSSQSTVLESLESPSIEPSTIDARSTGETRSSKAESSEIYSTKTIVQTQTAWHTETETTTVELTRTGALAPSLEDERETTVLATEKYHPHDGAYRYCSACQQKHCCQFP